MQWPVPAPEVKLPRVPDDGTSPIWLTNFQAGVPFVSLSILQPEARPSPGSLCNFELLA